MKEVSFDGTVLHVYGMLENGDLLCCDHLSQNFYLRDLAGRTFKLTEEEAKEAKGKLLPDD